MKLIVLVAAASLIAAVSPAPGAAQSGPETNQVAVAYGDLDLTKPAGQATLDKRLARAVERVCDPGWTRSVRVATQTRACIAQKHAELATVRARLIADAWSENSASDLAARQR